MGKEDILIMEELQRKYFHQVVELEKGEKVKFQNREELAKFVAFYFTSKYCDTLMYQKPEVRKNEKDLEIWQRKITEEIEPVYEAFKVAIYNQYGICDKRKKGLLFKIGMKNYDKIIIDSKLHSEIYKYVMDIIKNEFLPQHTFPIHVKYVMDLSEWSFSKV